MGKRHLLRLVKNRETKNLTCPPDLMPAATCSRQVSCLKHDSYAKRIHSQNDSSPQRNATQYFGFLPFAAKLLVMSPTIFPSFGVLSSSGMGSALWGSVVWQLLCQLLRENGSESAYTARASLLPVFLSLIICKSGVAATIFAFFSL